MTMTSKMTRHLLLGAALLTMGASLLQVQANEASANLTPQSALTRQARVSPNYEDLKKQLEASSLTATDKAAALKALEANKTLFTQRADLEKKLLNGREDKLGKLEAAYTKLMTSNQKLWTKFYGSDVRRWDEQDDHLDDWELDDVLELKAGLQATQRLTATEKDQLLADLAELEKLKTDWDKANLAYQQESLSLRQDLAKVNHELMQAFRQDKNLSAVLTHGYGHWGDWDDWDDQNEWFDQDDDFFEEDDRDDWFD